MIEEVVDCEDLTCLQGIVYIDEEQLDTPYTGLAKSFYKDGKLERKEIYQEGNRVGIWERHIPIKHIPILSFFPLLIMGKDQIVSKKRIADYVKEGICFEIGPGSPEWKVKDEGDKLVCTCDFGKGEQFNDDRRMFNDWRMIINLKTKDQPKYPFEETPKSTLSILQLEVIEGLVFDVNSEEPVTGFCKIPFISAYEHGFLADIGWDKKYPPFEKSADGMGIDPNVEHDDQFEGFEEESTCFFSYKDGKRHGYCEEHLYLKDNKLFPEFSGDGWWYRVRRMYENGKPSTPYWIITDDGYEGNWFMCAQMTLKDSLNNQETVFERFVQKGSAWGVMVEKKRFKEGKLNGLSEYFDDGGELVRTETYQKGKLVNIED